MTYREVDLLTPGETLNLEANAADRLECLIEIGLKNPGLTEDIHRFTLCFESATGSVFTMPGRYWVDTFRSRIGRQLKACEITLAEGTHGADSLWDAQVLGPRKADRRRYSRGRG